MKRAKKRGKGLDKFKVVASALLEEQVFESVYRDHPLVGAWSGRRECHPEPDWLLIYKVDFKRVVFERMGTHTDLFEK